MFDLRNERLKSSCGMNGQSLAGGKVDDIGYISTVAIVEGKSEGRCNKGLGIGWTACSTSPGL